MIPDPLKRMVRLPVKLVEGKWKLFDGESLPEIKDGTVGDLVIPSYSVCDEEVRQSWMAEKTIGLCKRDAQLWARVRLTQVPKDLLPLCVEKKYTVGYLCRFVLIELKEDLTLILKPDRKAALNDCRCSIPALKADAGSINEAYKKVSTAFEPGRRSHTGNVFDCVYFEGKKGVRPLDDLRAGLGGGFIDKT